MSEGGHVSVVARPRRNGWSCPPHPLQVLAWSLIVVLAVTHYGFLVFYIPGLWRILGYVIPGLVLLFLLLGVVMTTSIDPSEDQVRRKVGGGHQLRPVFDRTVHGHVIENRHCNICQVDVSASAKHCRLCDKCIHDFDHHCKWLNNCIGGRNYRWFLATLSLGLTGILLLLLYTLALFILFFADREHLRYNCDHPTNATACDDALRVFGAVVPDAVFPTLTGILCLLALAGTPAVGHLLVFHLYLLSKGISTYDYIVMQREKEREREVEDGTARHGRCALLRSKFNRVGPAPLPEVEEGVKDKEDSGSIGSAGMVNFGRTPPPSEISEGSRGSLDDRTEEQKLGVEANWAYTKLEENTGTGDSIPRHEMVDRRPLEGGLGEGGGQGSSSSPTHSPQREKGRTASNMEQGGSPLTCEGEERESSTVPQDEEGSASSEEEKEGRNEDGEREFVQSLAATMASASSLPDQERLEMDVLKEEEGEDTVRGGGVTLCSPANGRPEVSLEDRHKELKTVTLQGMATFGLRVSLTPPPSVSSPRPFTESGSGSRHSLHSGLLPSSPSPSPSLNHGPHRRTFTSPTNLSAPPREDSLQELPLSSLRDLTQSPGVEDELGSTSMSIRSSTPSPMTKHRVSFERGGAEQHSLSLSPRPLPPLPPIGGNLLPYETRYKDLMIQRGGGGEELHYLCRGPQSRPLPPLSLDNLLGSQDSLQSVPSSLLFYSTSTNSLPQPNPLYSYRRSTALPPVASSNFSLDSAGVRKEKDKGGKHSKRRREEEGYGSMPSERTSRSPLSGVHSLTTDHHPSPLPPPLPIASEETV